MSALDEEPAAFGSGCFVRQWKHPEQFGQIVAAGAVPGYWMIQHADGGRVTFSEALLAPFVPTDVERGKLEHARRWFEAAVAALGPRG